MSIEHAGIVYLDAADLPATGALVYSAGEIPLITRLASFIRGGHMSAEVAVYTRKVTIAWALFTSLETSLLHGVIEKLPISRIRRMI